MSQYTCEQCDGPGCFWCEAPDVSEQTKAIRKKLDDRKGGHVHRCSTCCYNNIQKSLRQMGILKSKRKKYNIQ